MAVSSQGAAIPVGPGGTAGAISPDHLAGVEEHCLSRGRIPLQFFLSAVLLTTGCANRVYENTADVLDRPTHASNDTLAGTWFKTSYVYPGRDYITFTWLGRVLLGDEAWNVGPDGRVADGPFFVNRDIGEVSASQLLSDPFGAGAPSAPWRIEKQKKQGTTPGFVGQDATGRTFIVKLDNAEYPEQGTSAEIIGSRIYWLLGYRIPPTYLVTLDHTGDGRFDGQRATASLYVPGRVLGSFPFDRFSLRREVRAARLVAAWLNDTDRTDNNTLLAIERGRVCCYFVDFNSCLGSWNGRPKEPWRGWRHAWDVECQLIGLLTLGLLPRLPDSVPISSPAVGSLDLLTWNSARAWRAQNPNAAFDRLTQADAAWIGRRMAAISVDQLRAIVLAADLTDPSDAAELLDMLISRRAAVLRAWGLEALLNAPSKG